MSLVVVHKKLSFRLPVVAKVLGVIILAFIVSLAVLQHAQPAYAEPNTEPLKWAPPTLTNPVTINLGTGPTTTTLDDNTDYIINLPSGIKYGKTQINGGRNVVIIGGEIVIPDNPGPSDADRRAIYIKDNVGVVHIEGVLFRNIHNVDALQDYEPYDAISINAPESVVQIQNVRMEGLYGTQAGFHSDAVQPWGGVERLRIYNLSVISSYQALQIAEDLREIGGAYLENIDLTYDSAVGTDGGYLLYLDVNQECTGPDGIYGVVIDELYISPRIPRFGLTDETDAVGRSIMPDSITNYGCRPVKTPDSSTGPNWYYPDLDQISDSSGSNGIIKTGTPPVAGDTFVPYGTPGLGVPGVGYISPDYVDDEYTPVAAMPTVTDPIVPPGGGQAGNVALVQSASNQNPQTAGTPSMSVAATFTETVTDGNTIIVAVNNYNNLGGPGGITSISDNFGNTYLLAEAINGTVAITNGTRWYGSIWYATDVTGGEDLVVTANYGTNSYYAISAMEYEGLYADDILADSSSFFQSSASTTGTSGALTTTTANNLLVANFSLTSGSVGTTVTAYPSTYTMRQFYSGVPGLALSDGFSTDPGSYTANITWSTSQTSLGVLAAFQPAPVPDAFTPAFDQTSPTNDTTPTLTFSTTDDIGIDYYQVKVDDGSFSTQTSPYILPAQTDGLHTVTVRAYNTAGGYRDGFASITIDTTPPDIFGSPGTTNSSGPVTDTTVTVSDEGGILAGDVSGTGGGVYCEQSAADHVDCSTVISTSGTLSITATDIAGNSATQIIGTYTIGGAAPAPATDHFAAVAAPVCGANVPVGQPDLFQINRSGKSAKLYFTPVNGDIQAYNVTFGYSEGDERFGSISEPVTYETNNGVQSISIHELNPRVEYWFKVIPVSGCATGTWSNWMKAGRVTRSTSIFYRYLPQQLQR